MKKSIVAVSILTGIVMLCTGCVDLGNNNTDPPVRAFVVGPEIPGNGGEVSGDARETEHAFIPENSGIWVFKMTMGGDGGVSLEIVFPDDSIVKTDGYHSAYLLEGSTYKIIAGVWTYTAGNKNSYVLTVSPAEPIPDVGGEFHIDRHTTYSFTPTRTGVWTFQTSNNGDTVPFININDRLRGIPGPYNNSGANGNNALITAEFEEGVAYSIELGFYLQQSGEFTLTVSPVEPPDDDGPI